MWDATEGSKGHRNEEEKKPNGTQGPSSKKNMKKRLLQRARHYKRTRQRRLQQKHKFYVNKQPAFRGKQQSARFAAKRQQMLTPVSNSGNLCSASPFFGLIVCKHKAFFGIHPQEALNMRVEKIKHKQSARRPMPLHKRTPQEQARRLQQQTPFSDAPHNNTARIHLLFWFQKALDSPHSRYAAQQPAATRTKSVQS